MSTAEITYLGELRTRATHIRSGQEIITDAPPDNHGKGEAFSPTDLVSTAFVSCMITVMGIAANTHNIDLSGLRATVQKHMASDPRRISGLEVKLYFARTYTDHDRVILERTARTCPVALSLHPDLVQDFSFHYAS